MGGPTTHRGIVHVSHHMFYLADIDSYPEPPFAAANGLIAVQSGCAVIFTGASSGVVTVEIDVRQKAPTTARTEGWDEVIETSLNVPGGRLTVAAPMDNTPDLPALTTAGPGSYRILVHARGRDTAPDVVAFQPVEVYLFIVWPAPAQPETVYKYTDTYGAGLRESTATQPTPRRPATMPHRERRRRASPATT